MKRHNRRIRSEGTITFRDRIPGGTFIRTTSAEPFTTTRLWLGWMLDNKTLASATWLDNSSTRRNQDAYYRANLRNP